MFWTSAASSSSLLYIYGQFSLLVFLVCAFSFPISTRGHTFVLRSACGSYPQHIAAPAWSSEDMADLLQCWHCTLLLHHDTGRMPCCDECALVRWGQIRDLHLAAAYLSAQQPLSHLRCLGCR